MAEYKKIEDGKAELIREYPDAICWVLSIKSQWG